MSEFWKSDLATNAADECDRLEAENRRLKAELAVALHEERTAIQTAVIGISPLDGSGQLKRAHDVTAEALELITARMARGANPLEGWLPPHQVARVRELLQEAGHNGWIWEVSVSRALALLGGKS